MVSRLAVLAIFIGLVVCLDAFHIGVGKISIRRKRPRRTLLIPDIKESLEELCIFTKKHCHNLADMAKKQALADALMHARRQQTRRIQKALKRVCKASTKVCL